MIVAILQEPRSKYQSAAMMHKRSGSTHPDGSNGRGGGRERDERWTSISTMTPLHPTFDLPISHLKMLNDRTRTQRYFDALQDLVRPDSVVVDVGTGSGVLASMAIWRRRRSLDRGTIRGDEMQIAIELCVHSIIATGEGGPSRRMRGAV